MTDGFLDQAIGTVVAGVLALTAGLGTPVQDEAAPKDQDSGQDSGARNPLADKVEPLAKDDRAARADEPPVGTLGRDIGWPNCPTGLGIPERRTLGKPLPPPSARYVVVGLTNGPAFFPNPCLREQVAYLRRLHQWTSVYAVVTYPTPGQLSEFGGSGPRDGSDAAGRLFNTGYAQAEVNVRQMRSVGLAPPALWLDVEPVRPPAPWSSDRAANRTVLEGSIAAYRKAGLKLGVYSTQYLWRDVVGDARYGFPEWRAAGPTSQRRALAQCAPGRTIQGGRAVIGQWSDVDVDYNVLCPGRAPLAVMRDYFQPL